jgi:predicted metal-dependent peptidase
MAKKKDQDAYNKLIRARTNLLVSNGFFGFLAMHLNIVEATEENGLIKTINTMAVDGYNLFYNPAFVHKMSERECEGVIAHEVMHCCFQHFSRRQYRELKKWNIAGDHVINLDLLESGFVLPDLAKIFNNPEAKICADPKYKGMATETVYDLLPDAPIKVQFVGGGGSGTGGEEGEDPGGCGGVMDAPGDTAEQAESARSWEQNVRAAVAVARANNIGNLPSSLKSLVDQLEQSKVSWRDLTRRWIDNSLAKEVSWARLSRRSVSVGVPLPGMISDRLSHLVMCIDTSGSITEKMIREFVGEVAGALDQGTADRVTVIYADTQVQHVDEFYAGDYVTAGHYNGGGTAFSDTFRYISKNIPDASAVIYLTDLCVKDFGQDPGCPTLWAVYSPEHNYQQLIAAAPFGEGVHVSNIAW